MTEGHTLTGEHRGREVRIMDEGKGARHSLSVKCRWANWHNKRKQVSVQHSLSIEHSRRDKSGQ